MPHQCVRCSAMYEDGAQEILKGCPCGARLFFFIRKERLEAAKKILPADLKPEQKQQIEKDVLNLVGAPNNADPVILDFESVRVLEPGKYELDVVNLFDKKRPLIYKLEEGKYIIDLTKTHKVGMTEINEKIVKPIKKRGKNDEKRGKTEEDNKGNKE